jgi:hypothetical protein
VPAKTCGIDFLFLVIQTIESVEQEVERLLEQDAAASQVKYGSHESVPSVLV